MIPKKWEDISPDIAVSIAPDILRGVDDVKAKLKILEALLPSEVLPVFAKLKPAKIRPLLKDTEWVFTTPIIKPHLHTFTINDVQYHLPKETFKNVHLIEYSYATNFYRHLAEKKDFKALNKIIASLCRPAKLDLDEQSPDYNGDPREKFNPTLIDQRAELFDSLPAEFKAYFIIYFNSCSEHITKQFKVLFDGDTEGAKGPNFGWLGVIYGLADSGVFGNFEQCQFTNIYTALGYRLKKYYEAKEISKA
jgi:hypothetical protein